jgi:hypothetical protein
MRNDIKRDDYNIEKIKWWEFKMSKGMNWFIKRKML